MYTINVIQGPKTIYDNYDEDFSKRLESIVSIEEINYTIDIEGTDKGFYISYHDANNKVIKDKSSWDFDEKTHVDNILGKNINDILEKLAYGTFYGEIQQGDIYSSEEILSWEF